MKAKVHFECNNYNCDNAIAIDITHNQSLKVPEVCPKCEEWSQGWILTCIETDFEGWVDLVEVDEE